MTLLSVNQWTDNAEMIQDIGESSVHYIGSSVLDATYGEGNFWTRWKPKVLTTNDLHKPADYSYDFTSFGPFPLAFDTVVFDPPYKLSGTPALEGFDDRYGIAVRTTAKSRLDLILAGALECFRVTRGTLLVKCQDQVNGGRVRWQTDMVTEALLNVGARKVDRFDFVYTPRSQPSSSVQQHASHNASQLLVFDKR